MTPPKPPRVWISARVWTGEKRNAQPSPSARQDLLSRLSSALPECDVVALSDYGKGALSRPFFDRIILHWHAAGLAKWLEMVMTMRWRSLTYRLMKQVDLSIVLSQYNRADAEKLFSQRIKIVSNGIPDPCADFEQTVIARRRHRAN